VTGDEGARDVLSGDRAETVSVVVISWNGAELLQACLPALEAQERRADEVIVVDNGSTDESVRLLRSRFPWVRVVELPVNRGFAGGANAGIEAATSSWIALLNNDALPELSWLGRLMAAARCAPSSIGFLTSKILDAEGRTIDSAGDFIDWAFTAHQRGHGQPANDPEWDEKCQLTAACAAATVYRRAYFDDVGLFDDRFFAYFEDADLCLRGVWRGWSGEYVPAAQVHHATSTTSARVPGFKRYQGTRNSWWLLYKNLPISLAPRVVPRFLLTQLIWLWRAGPAGELGAALRGHLHGIAGLRRLRADRRCIMRTAHASGEVIAEGLEPPVSIRQALRRMHAVIGRGPVDD
jgi:GT2 family glycosyltransferase